MLRQVVAVNHGVILVPEAMSSCYLVECGRKEATVQKIEDSHSAGEVASEPKDSVNRHLDLI